MKSYCAIFSLTLFVINEHASSQSIYSSKFIKSFDHITKMISNEVSTNINEDFGNTIEENNIYGKSSSVDLSEVTTEKSTDLDYKSVHKPCFNFYKNNSISCSCHSKCSKFSDCCWDSAIENNATDMEYRCISIEDDLKSTYMISHCPSQWIDRNTKIYCEKQDDNFLSRLPVTSKYNFQTYRNIYCAICNSIIDVVPWSPYFTCYDSDQNCLICNSQKNDGASPKCVTFYAPIKHIDLKNNVVISNNEFCASCSDFKTDSLEYSDMETTLATLPQITNALPLQANFKFSNGIVIFDIKKCFEKDNKPSKIRKDFYCGGLFEIKKGKCIMNNLELRIYYKLKQSILNSNCEKMSVDNDDYEALENGLIILNKEERSLEVGEYHLLSNMSILICVPVKEKVYELSKEQSYTVNICLSISAICLSIKIILYLIGAQKKTLMATIIFYVSFSILLGQILILVSSGKIYYPVCISMAVFKHYFFLVSLFGTNALALDVWKIFPALRKSKQLQGRKLIPYIFYCWGMPVIIVLSAIVNEWIYKSKFSPQYGNSSHNLCWISNRLGFLMFFALPLVLVSIINIIFCISTGILIIKIPKSLKVAKDRTINKNYLLFAIFITLTLIMVFTWIVGFAASYSETEVLWYPFIIMNGFQGIYLLLSFTALDSFKNCFRKLRRKKQYNYDVKNARAELTKTDRI